MAGTVVFCLEGVLAKTPPPNGIPIWVGIQLYHSLASQFRIVVDSTHDDITDIEHWLQVNALKRHTLILWQDEVLVGATDPMIRDRHLAEWRSQGFDVALYVTASPAEAALMVNGGVPTLLFAHPQYARPEHRPDHISEMRPWAEIEDEVTAQLKLRETSPRIDAEMDFRE
jgi:hypothetical protein